MAITIRNVINDLSFAFKATPARARPADRPPRNPWAGYTGYTGAAMGVYPDNFAGWMAAAKYNVWARNCILARQTFVSKANLKLWQPGEDGKPVEVKEHDVLTLLRNVNALNANRKSFRRAIEKQLCTFGRCIVLPVAGVDKPRELYILSRQLVEVLPSADNWIEGYRWLPTGQVYTPSEIIDLYYPSGDGTPAEESPTSSAVGAITRYALADRAQAAIDQRGGQGGGIVFYPDGVNDDEFNATKEAWENIRSNPANAGRDIHVTSAIKYETGALTARDQQREERAMRLINEIVAAYQCTPIKAGDYSDASKLANAAVQSREFAEEWGVEELEFIEEAFNNDLLWRYWPEAREAGLYLAHDLAEIPALREDQREEAETQQVKVQAISVARAARIVSLNEARTYIGVTRINDPRADQVEFEDAAEAPPAASDAGGQGVQDTSASTKAQRIIADYVGVKVRTPAGEGVIERVVRFGEHSGRTATKASPLFIVAGAAWGADELEVIE